MGALLGLLDGANDGVSVGFVDGLLDGSFDGVTDGIEDVGVIEGENVGDVEFWQITPQQVVPHWVNMIASIVEDS